MHFPVDLKFGLLGRMRRRASRIFFADGELLEPKLE